MIDEMETNPDAQNTGREDGHGSFSRDKIIPQTEGTIISQTEETMRVNLESDGLDPEEQEWLKGSELWPEEEQDCIDWLDQQAPFEGSSGKFDQRAESVNRAKAYQFSGVDWLKYAPILVFLIVFMFFLLPIFIGKSVEGKAEKHSLDFVSDVQEGSEYSQNRMTSMNPEDKARMERSYSYGLVRSDDAGSLLQHTLHEQLLDRLSEADAAATMKRADESHSDHFLPLTVSDGTVKQAQLQSQDRSVDNVHANSELLDIASLVVSNEGKLLELNQLYDALSAVVQSLPSHPDQASEKQGFSSDGAFAIAPFERDAQYVLDTTVFSANSKIGLGGDLQSSGPLEGASTSSADYALTSPRTIAQFQESDELALELFEGYLLQGVYADQLSLISSDCRRYALRAGDVITGFGTIDRVEQGRGVVSQSDRLIRSGDYPYCARSVLLDTSQGTFKAQTVIELPTNASANN